MAKKIFVVSHSSGKSYLVKTIEADFHTTEGVLSKEDLVSNAPVIKSSKNKYFSKIKATLPDLKQEFARGPQIITEKDIGYILAKTGVNKESSAVDAGGGSGVLSLALANICKTVTCYDINEKHIKVIEKNKKIASAENLIVKQGDVAELLSELDLDLITLDLPEPDKALGKVESALKLGGWLVIYLPNILQMKTVLDELKNYKSLKLQELTEITKRDWKVEQDILRPEHTQIVHTGFLAFVRKL